jgi:hypothetical protein
MLLTPVVVHEDQGDGMQLGLAGALNLSGSDSSTHCWGLILAGGDGQRLLPYTRKITGDDRPKQFCCVLR